MPERPGGGALEYFVSYTCTFSWLARPSRAREWEGCRVPDVATGVFSWEEASDDGSLGGLNRAER